MMPKYIDIHSHVNFKAFKEDGDVVLKRALQNDTWVINVGSQLSTSKRAVEIANKYEEGIFAIVGLHPIHLEEAFHDKEETGGGSFMTRVEEFNKDIYRELLQDPKVVALGECGWDYFHCGVETIEKQKKTFREQISLSQETGKPLMLHIRNNPKDSSLNAYQDVLEILKEFPKAKGNVHFFSGVITFTRAYDEIIKNIPLDMIMSETDAPYVAPVPYRGQRNEPSYVKEVVKKIAQIKGISEEETREAIIANVKRVF